jgi:hypothetical protein
LAYAAQPGPTRLLAAVLVLDLEPESAVVELELELEVPPQAARPKKAPLRATTEAVVRSLFMVVPSCWEPLRVLLV